MKHHAIIPIFIPHKGCPNDCVFCNQKKITARQKPVTTEDVEKIIETWLSTLENRGISTIETAFYGGSFTGLPMEEQSAYLSVAKRYKDAGRIGKIHLSTRPDYIDERILSNLKTYGVDTVELGVQSFSDVVLSASGRGHDSRCVYESSRLIQDFGFELGIQLMIGLPKDSRESCLYSARETVKIGPAIARLYPTVILADTALADLYTRGVYAPLSEEEAILRTKEMYKILDSAGVNIIRVGLKSSDILNENGQVCANTFHPAFRQLTEGEIAKEKLEKLLRAQLAENPDFSTSAAAFDRKIPVDFYTAPENFSNMIGHGGRNREYFLANYPSLNIKYKVNNNLSKHQYQIIIKENYHERNI